MIEDKAPVPMTCPLIDEIIESIDSEEYDKENVIQMIEQVRKANSRLRTWGNELNDKIENYDKDDQTKKLNGFELFQLDKFIHRLKLI